MWEKHPLIGTFVWCGFGTPEYFSGCVIFKGTWYVPVVRAMVGFDPDSRFSAASRPHAKNVMFKNIPDLQEKSPLDGRWIRWLFDQGFLI